MRVAYPWPAATTQLMPTQGKANLWQVLQSLRQFGLSTDSLSLALG